MRILITVLFLVISALAACSRAQSEDTPPTSTPLSPTIIVEVVTSEPPRPTLTPQATTEPASEWKTFENSEFGLGFQFPQNWFGPDQYISDQVLRLQVGSDKVYPYGTDLTQQIYEVPNSYYVLIQYSKNDPNTNWKDTYELLSELGDGEEFSSGRSLLIKVRDLELGRFKGVEYISTLSQTAQTEPVYAREIILFDEQPNVITIRGTPNTVELSDGTPWREAFERIDRENRATFYRILESITIL